MDFDLNNQNVLISGSTKGLGKEIARCFKQAGSSIAINGRNAEDLKKTKEEICADHAFQGDVTNDVDTAQVLNAAIDVFGKIDILICNVGSGSNSNWDLDPLTPWKHMMDVNFWSAVNLIESIEALQPNHPISIVCISSICGIEIVSGAPPAYAVAKSALNSYVRVKSKGLKSVGSRINAIAPGNILHENSTWLKKLNEDSTEVNDYIKKNVPLKRMASTSEIADLVLYLASPKASFVSGSIWTIDGGQVNSL